MGRDFRWLWAAFAVSTFGTYLAFDAFPLIAILALHAGPAAVSALASVGLAAGALIAVPLGPWVEVRRKRPVMVAMDLTRFGALASIPAAYALGGLTLVQLLGVSVVVAAAGIGHRAASGAALKGLVPPDQLLPANARFESTLWTATVVGPPLGGAAIGLLGPVVTVIADAVSYLLSALGIRAIGRPEAMPDARMQDLTPCTSGWRFILEGPLRPLFFNTVCVNALILAGAPLMAVLMVGRLGFEPWEYAVAFGVPCVGGLVGARLSPKLVALYGRARVLRGAGTLRACWPVGLAFVTPGWPGLALVMVLQFGLLTSIGIFNPVYATERLQRTRDDRIARVLAAWTVTSNLTVAATTALWGVLAAAIGVREAVALAGALMLATPLLLRNRAPARGTRGRP